MIGTLFGSYRVVGVIGSGGMGTIYRAEHALIGKPAAVKVLNPTYAVDRGVVNRFFNEARAATTIQHPGIVEVFDFGYQPDGTAYIVMEFLKGESLASRLSSRGTLSETEAFAIARGIATALAAAHSINIVHRDIKPDNVFLVPEPEAASGERVKLLDFGIAKLTDETNTGWTATRTGAVLGTPSYMAPEQCAGAGHVDHRADLYSLGCLMFEMLSGRPPFVGAGVGEVLGAHQYVAAPRLRDFAPGASREADEIIALLLAKRADDRVASANELVRMLGARRAAVATGSHHHLAVGVTGEIGSTTTLGGAALTLPPAPARPRRARWPIAVAAALTIGAGAIALIALSGGSSATTPPPAAPRATAPPPPRPPSPAATIDAGVAPVDAAAPDASPVDAMELDAARPSRPSSGSSKRPRPGAGTAPKPTGPTLIEDI